MNHSKTKARPCALASTDQKKQTKINSAFLLKTLTTPTQASSRALFEHYFLHLKLSVIWKNIILFSQSHMHMFSQGWSQNTDACLRMRSRDYTLKDRSACTLKPTDNNLGACLPGILQDLCKKRSCNLDMHTAMSTSYLQLISMTCMSLQRHTSHRLCLWLLKMGLQVLFLFHNMKNILKNKTKQNKLYSF